MQKNKSNKQFFKTFFEPFFADNKSYLFHIGINVVFLVIGLASIELIRRLILSIEKNQGLEVTMQYGIVAIILVIILFAGKLATSYLRPKNLIKLMNFLSKKYLNKYILLDNEKVNNYGTGKFISIINGGTVSWAECLYIIFFEILISIIGFIFNISMIGYINSTLIIPVIIITLLLFLAMNFTGRRTINARKERKVLREKHSKQILKILMEKFTILKNSKQDIEINKAMNINLEIAEKGKIVSFYTRLLEEGSNIILSIGEIILILIIGYYIYHSNGNFADIGVLLFIMALIKGNVSTASLNYRQIINMFPDVERMMTIFDEIKPIEGYYEGKDYEYKGGSIEVKNISYNYDNSKNVFDGLSLKIQPKSKVAFIGKSGSGKSTLVKLILGFIKQKSGDILVDGQKLSEVNLKSYYKYIGYLSQEPNVFDGSVLENLIYGLDDNEKINDDKLKEIIKLSSCSFVYDLPNGLETQIGEKGIKLSGGERQRIAIARMLLENPNIIILDEPTSALDSFSEDEIKKALKNLTKEKTVITIAHRLQTIKSSDNIFIFDNGKIIGEGNHKELLKKSEVYRKLIDLQGGGVY